MSDDPSDTTAVRNSGENSRRGWLRSAAEIFAVVIAGMAVLGWFGPWFWAAELATHFRVFYLLGALVALGIFVWARAWAWMALAALLVVWNGAAILPWYFPAHNPDVSGGAQLTLFTANLNFANANHDAFLEAVKDSHADVIFVQELSPQWDLALEPLGKQYPHVIARPQPGQFGIGVYSRYPIERVDVDQVAGINAPVIMADIVVRGVRVPVVAFHALPPLTPVMAAWRNQQLEWVAEYAAGHSGPLIVAGDFNCTMWSPKFQAMIAKGGLRNARRGHGIAATWLPVLGLVRMLPLDHVLVKGPIATESFRVGPAIGSDHRPVIAKFTIGGES